MSIKVKGALTWVIFFQLISFLSGSLTQQGLLSWYPALHKSVLTPPGFAFPVVWFILYCMLAVSGYVLWQSRHRPKARLAFKFFVLQMLLNWSWSLLFFYMHWVGLSFFCIVAMIILTLIIMSITRNNSRLSCRLLIPYFFWLIFAGYLNAVIWILNNVS